jgi:hypothetical protein
MIFPLMVEPAQFQIPVDEITLSCASPSTRSFWAKDPSNRRSCKELTKFAPLGLLHLLKKRFNPKTNKDRAVRTRRDLSTLPTNLGRR